MLATKPTFGRSNIFVNYIKVLIFDLCEEWMPRIATILVPKGIKTSIQLKLKVVVGVCNYVIFLANIFR